MKDFFDGFRLGLRNTLCGYFSPGVALWRLLRQATDALVRRGR